MVKIVLVKHTKFQESEFGSCYTIKEYHSQKTANGEQWSHEKIFLKPLSYNSEYKNIELSVDKASTLKVIGVFERVLANI